MPRGAAEHIEPPAAGSARHAAWLYTPVVRRDALTALLALEREIAASASGTLAHEVAHIRLEWWQAESARLALGAALHPLSRGLLAATQRQSIAPPDLLPWLESVRQSLAHVAWLDRSEFVTHCRLWADGIWLSAVRLLAGDASAAALPAARDMGVALRELELLTTLAADARHGRVSLPIDELTNVGASTEDCYAAPWSPAVARLIGTRTGSARATLAQAAAQYPAQLWPALRGLAAWVALADRAAARVQRALPAAVDPQFISFAAQSGDTLAAWRAARRAQHGRAPLKPVA